MGRKIKMVYTVLDTKAFQLCPEAIVERLITSDFTPKIDC